MKLTYCGDISETKQNRCLSINLESSNSGSGFTTRRTTWSVRKKAQVMRKQKRRRRKERWKDTKKAVNLSRRNCSKRRHDVRDKTACILPQRSITEWPSFLADRCEYGEVAIETIYSVLRFRLLPELVQDCQEIWRGALYRASPPPPHFQPYTRFIWKPTKIKLSEVAAAWEVSFSWCAFKPC